MCEQVVCESKSSCVWASCVRASCVMTSCVWTRCVERCGGGRREADGGRRTAGGGRRTDGGIQNQKQEPHTKMCGKTPVVVG